MKFILCIVLLLCAVMATASEDVQNLYVWGKSESNEQHLYLAKVWTEFPGESFYRYPEPGYKHLFRITRIEVRDYNPWTSVVELLTPGINSTYVHFRFESRDMRALKLEYDIWGVYNGNCLE